MPNRFSKPIRSKSRDDASWLSESPDSGTILPANNQLITVTFDASELTPDIYTANILIDSNDPDEPVKLVPVTFTVNQAGDPVADFIAEPDSGLVPLDVTFTDAATAGDYPIESWAWDFDGDGSTDTTGQGPHQYTYSTPNDYYATLMVEDTKGNTDSKTRLIVVEEIIDPIADFSYEQPPGYAPFTVEFTDESIEGTYPIASWAWDFDDDGESDSAEPNPTWEYTESGDYPVSLTVTDEQGGTDTETQIITITEPTPPDANFIAEPDSGFAPLEVDFTDTSIEGDYSIETWEWDLDGDGTYETTGQGPHQYTYDEAGDYTTKLKITDEQGGTDIKTKIIMIEEPVYPEADFTAQPSSGIAPLTVTFTDQSTEGTYSIQTWEWDLDGDGTYETTGQGPHQYTYNEAGDYTTKLKITDEQGNTDTKTKTINVVQAGDPLAAFIAEPENGFAPLEVTFTDQSVQGDYPIESWKWDFDNNGDIDATGQGPHQFTYGDSGSYVAKLKITDEGGMTDSTTTTIDVDIQPINADFSAEPSSGYAPLTVTFTDQSIGGTYPIETWEWDIDGDGTYETTGQGPHDHTYNEVGDYTTKLKITDEQGNTDTKTKIITVEQSEDPVANFQAEPPEGYAPMDVTFTDQSIEGSYPIIRWEWDFDNDGSIDVTDSTGNQTHIHRYEEAGVYTAKLTITDSSNNIDSETKIIDVNPATSPTADFIASPMYGYAPLQVTFTDNSEEGSFSIESWEWDFDGDDVVDTTGQGPHLITYSQAGNYTAKLLVTDTNENSDTETKNITVISIGIDPPIISGVPGISPSSPNQGEAITISVQITGTNPVVTLTYGKTAQNTGTEVEMSANGNTYSAEIPSDMVTAEGIWYQIKAENSSGTVYHPSEFSGENIPIGITDFSTIQSSGAFPEGISQNQWHTVSLPFDVSVAISDIFGTQQFNKNNEPTNWRVFRYDGDYKEVTTFENKIAYFVYQKTGSSRQIDITSATTNNSEIFGSITLMPGWNLVPWSYAFSSNLNVIDDTKIGSIWQLDDGSWTQVTEAIPYAGYAIYNKTEENIKISEVLEWMEDVASRGNDNTLSEDEWRIQLKAETNSHKDYYNFIGASAVSDESFDNHDEAEPPSPGENISLYFPKDEKPNKLSSDIRSSNVMGNIWEMRLDNSTQNSEVVLTWNAENLPVDFKAVLVDISNNEFIELEKTIKSYQFKSRESHKFKVIAGEPHYVDTKTEQLRNLMPERFSLGQNYPNPFNPITTINIDVPYSTHLKINIYNINGQLVKTLTDDYYETGNYRIKWNGTDESGRKSASGMYIYRLEAEGVSETKRMILVK